VKRRGKYFAPLSKRMPLTIPTVPMTVFSLGGTFMGGGGQVDGRLGGGGYEEAATPAMESKERSRDTGTTEMKAWDAKNPGIRLLPFLREIYKGFLPPKNFFGFFSMPRLLLFPRTLDKYIAILFRAASFF